MQCQWLHVGIKGGLTLTPDRDLKRIFPSSEGDLRVNRGSVGPYLEFTPFRSLPGLETGFLYKRLRTSNYYGPFPNVALNYITSTATLLEIPLLLKWHHRSLFASAGATIRRTGDYAQNYRFVPLFPGFSTTETRSQVSNENRMLYGATVAAGYSKPWGRLRIEPEIRFTRWTALREVPRQNQVEFLLGISF